MKVPLRAVGITLALALSEAGAWSQTVTATDKADTKVADRLEGHTPDRVDTRPVQTFYLKYASQPNAGNEILTAVRLLLDPSVKMFLDPTQNALIVRATPEQLKLAERLIGELDRPTKVYRLIYTVTEMDSGKRIGVMHFAMVAASGGRTSVKQGSKVPIVTGSYDQGKNGSQTQFTYLDIGLNFDTTVNEVANGVTMRNKVEQSSIAEGESKVGPQDPIVRQTVLDGTSIATLGKPLVLGSLDIQGTTRRLDIEVVVDEVH
jgi:type II secretory pathway component GspD/PulD (secretin)